MNNTINWKRGGFQPHNRQSAERQVGEMIFNPVIVNGGGGVATVILIKPEDSDTITLKGGTQTTRIMFSDTGITVKSGHLSYINTQEQHTSWFAIG